jgi:hypothetical protein
VKPCSQFLGDWPILWGKPCCFLKARAAKLLFLKLPDWPDTCCKLLSPHDEVDP